MKIAVVGTRGVPASFGGIEKTCEELYSRIVKMGHGVTIYARQGYIGKNIKEFSGINIKPLWTFRSKYLEATFHTFWALLHVIFSDADIIHFHAQGPCIFAWIPRIFAPKKKLIFTCHGLDWQRDKWSPLAQSIIRIGEIFSAKLFETQLVCSKALKKYYKDNYGVESIVLTNGANITQSKQSELIKEKFGLNHKDYILSIGRLVPEKAPHKLIEAYKNLKTDKKLVIAGGSSATDDYVDYLKKLAKDDERIIFTSYLYGDELVEIYSNAYLYASTSELEGLPVTLLEAMSYSLPALVSGIPPHFEVIEENEKYGYLFSCNEVSEIQNKLEFVLNKSEEELINKGIKGQEKIKTLHNWDNISKKLELAYRLTQVKSRKKPVKI